MATKKPIVWNNALRIYEQLQTTDSLDVGSLGIPLSNVRDPVQSTTINLQDNNVNIVNGGSTLLKLLPATSTAEFGKNLVQIDGMCRSVSFFRRVTTVNSTPITFVHQRTTKCLFLSGKCYARNVSTGQDNVFTVDFTMVGDQSNTNVTAPNEAVAVILQQTPGLTLSISAASDVITFTVTGLLAATIQWSFHFNLTELDQ